MASGSLLFVSGQVGIDPSTGEPSGPDIASQTRQAVTNLLAVAKAGGAEPTDAVKVTVFLSDMALFPVFDAEYRSLMPTPHPARITIGADLGRWLIELDGVFGVT